MKRLIAALALIAGTALAVDEKVLINPVQDGNLTVKVNDGGVTTSVMTFQGASGNVGVGTTNPLVKLDITGALQTSSQHLGPVGSVSAPTYSFTGDANTGMYKGGADILKFATAGADRITVLADGKVGIGTTAPGGKLEVASGNVFFGDTANTFSTQGLTINQAGNDDEILALKSSDISHSATSATEADTFFTLKKSHANLGGLRATSYYGNMSTGSHIINDIWIGQLTMTGANTGMVGTRFLEPDITAASALAVTTASTLYIRNAPTASGSASITNSYALWVDEGNVRFDGNVGIGTTSPFATLSVAGNGFFNSSLTASNITATGTLSVTGLATFINASTTLLSASYASSTLGYFGTAYFAEFRHGGGDIFSG